MEFILDRKIITDMVAKGKKENLITILLTFFHPHSLQKDSNIKMIDTINEKKNIFKNLGVEVLHYSAFHKSFLECQYKIFARYLGKQSESIKIDDWL